MLISVTSPKKGMGQTITAINLGAMLSKLVQNDILLIDINQYCKDIELYLSNTHITKGIDDFYSLYHSGMLSQESFKLCVKNIYTGIDIMAASECFAITPKEANVLTQYIQYYCDMNIIDTVSGNNELTKEFLNQSDVIVVVINQMRNIMNLIFQNSVYRKQQGKVIFVINKYMDKLKESRINYDFGQIQKELAKLGFDQPVFTLDFDVSLINECNDQSVLNYVMGHNQTAYLKQLENIATYILNKGSGTPTVNSEIKTAWQKYFKLFPKFS